MPSDHEFLEHLLDAVDAVESGNRGSLSDDRWLRENYEGRFLPFVDRYVGSRDENVAAETILLLASARERSVLPEITDLSRRGGDAVRMACTAYLKTLEDDDEDIPRLFDIVEHEDGHRFMNAASKLSRIARAEDVQRARRTYGGVSGEMRKAMRAVIEGIIRRNPSMEPERDLLLSIPVVPDEDAFDRFLSRATEYIDVRYRENVSSKGGVSAKVYANVADALRTIRRRLYNEADNLVYYDLDKSDRFEELSGLLSWASSDLEKKNVFKDVRRRPSMHCLLYLYPDAMLQHPSLEGLETRSVAQWHSVRSEEETGTGPRSSSRLPAPIAERSARFLSNLRRAGPSTAGTASGSTSLPRGTGPGSESSVTGFPSHSQTS